MVLSPVSDMLLKCQVPARSAGEIAWGCVTTAAVSAAGAVVFVLPPRWGFKAPNRLDFAALVVFGVASALVALVSRARHRAAMATARAFERTRVAAAEARRRRTLGEVTARTDSVDKNLEWLLLDDSYGRRLGRWESSGWHYRPIWLRPTPIPTGPGPSLGSALPTSGHVPATGASAPGFGDVAADWGGPDALFKRVQAAQALAERVPTQASQTPVEVAEAVIGPRLDDETATALRRSESVHQGLAMLLASPAFQWRA